MKGKSVKEFTFKKKAQVVGLTIKSSVRVDGKEVHIDPQLLVVAARTTSSKEDLFRYELCSFPPSLFDKSYVTSASEINFSRCSMELHAS